MINRLNVLRDEYKNLLSQIGKQTDRIPGYGVIIPKLTIIPIQDRIILLKRMLDWMVKYPSMKFYDYNVDPSWLSYRDRSFTVTFTCKDCGREGHDSFGPSPYTDISDMQGTKEPYLVCSDCYYEYRDDYNGDRDYEPEAPEPEYISEELENDSTDDNPLIETKKKK